MLVSLLALMDQLCIFRMVIDNTCIVWNNVMDLFVWHYSPEDSSLSKMNQQQNQPLLESKKEKNVRKIQNFISIFTVKYYIIE